MIETIDEQLRHDFYPSWRSAPSLSRKSCASLTTSKAPSTAAHEVLSRYYDTLRGNR